MDAYIHRLTDRIIIYLFHNLLQHVGVLQIPPEEQSFWSLLLWMSTLQHN